ncbi:MULTISPECIES: Lrp/AsnC family transcriptional regulator [Bacillus cereus group]|uniref:Lrp/AsnC family transcriptional regulator n=1 Tax=Bacillus cereus group TaxID=86661 RepID=UPI001F3F8E39|nr:Lrp/AsnC family transcriptional regulator [Bacillus cereus]MCU5324857.1 Lrp/AsnC family transcriptional regulator [Bacillus cereus]MCU5715518.1 Lrp/AsnC family transcriptional regulator [Bacillus cereus]MDA1844669.1 Lrp/AsnC family transcriptional regulator [Bacillus cereus]
MVTEKELELLACLEKSSRLSVDTLAKLLNIEVEEVKKMVEKLEAEKIIVDYVTHIDWTKVKEHTGLTAMIDVKVTPKYGVGFDAVAEQIYRYSEVKSVYLMSGTYDLSITLEGKTMGEVAMFVSEKLATIESVVSTTTHFILKKYKHEGIIYEKNDDDKRIVVTP